MEIIGSGAFGLVIKVIQMKTGKKMAVKIINKNNFNQKNHIDHLKNEVNILNYLDNPRIMKVYDILDNHRYFFIFMELIEGGNLKDLIIKRYLDNNEYLFRDSECALIIKGILEALNYLHKKNIIHRDIKPENILFKNKNDLSSVILCDFGLSYHLNNYETSTSGSCGTVIYMAPEILLKRNYDVLVDSFSAGIVLFILCSGGMHPFYSGKKSRKEYINQLISQKGLCKFSLQMPLLARNLFLKLCKFEAMNRYEPYKALNHPWITRCTKSQIPMTLLEEYSKSEKIKIFRGLLSTPLALIICGTVTLVISVLSSVAIMSVMSAKIIGSNRFFCSLYAFWLDLYIS
jgi:serine/threonine protein kinase